MKRRTQITDPTLKELLDALIERDLIPRSRIGPIKTAVKQYAIILGYTEPAECPLTAFHLPDQRRNRLIEEKAEGSRRSSVLGAHAIRNLKNNVSYLIRTAVNHEIIGQMPAQFANSKTTYTIKTYNITSRNESSRPGKYIVDPVPDALVQELTDYEIWSTKLVNRHRPDSLKKRAISFSQH